MEFTAFDSYDEDWKSSMQTCVEVTQANVTDNPCPGCGGSHPGPTPFAILSAVLEGQGDLIKALHFASAISKLDSESEENLRQKIQIMGDVRASLVGLAGMAAVVSHELIKLIKGAMEKYEAVAGRPYGSEAKDVEPVQKETGHGEDWASLDG